MEYKCVTEKIDKGSVSSLIKDKIIDKILRLARKKLVTSKLFYIWQRRQLKCISDIKDNNFS